MTISSVMRVWLSVPIPFYTWMKTYAQAASKGSDVNHEVEIRRLKLELNRVVEERDILENRPGLWPACAR